MSRLLDNVYRDRPFYQALGDAPTDGSGPKPISWLQQDADGHRPGQLLARSAPREKASVTPIADRVCGSVSPDRRKETSGL